MPDAKKPELELVHSLPDWEMPPQSLTDFKRWVLEEGLAPSKAVRKLFGKYTCLWSESSVVIQLLRHTYPDIDLSSQGFRFYIIDSNYPNSDPEEFSDDDFDAGLARILADPTLGWGW